MYMFYVRVVLCARRVPGRGTYYFVCTPYFLCELSNTKCNTHTMLKQQQHNILVSQTEARLIDRDFILHAGR